MKQAFRSLLLTLILLVLTTPAVTAADYFHAFIYHRFGDDRAPSTNVSLAEFASQLRYLHDNGYNVLPLGEAVRRLKTGADFPEHCVVLTVDDAYSTFLAGAMPLLRQYRYPITLFVSTDMVGRRGYLTWNELRQLAAEGVEIGNHTATHNSLVDRLSGESPQQWRVRIKGDLQRAQEAVKRELGITPTLFAYPYGEYSLETIELVREFGFAAALGQHTGVVGRSANLLTLPRTPLTGRFASTANMMDKLKFRPLPVRRISPDDEILDNSTPPRLVLEILDPAIDPARISFFVNGQPGTPPRRVEGGAQRIEVQSTTPMTNRRDKYTLTVPGREKGTFYYFTQPWVRPALRQ